MQTDNRAVGTRTDATPPPVSWAQRLGACLLITLAVAARGSMADESAGQSGRRAELQQITAERLATHERHFPDIQFVALPRDGDWIDAMTALELLLGYQPTPLDYEHPPEVAELLLQVSVERIALFMQHRVPGATLFERGEQALAKRPKICVITLDESAIARDDQQATSYMLDLPEAAHKLVQDAQLIDADDYLRFTVDHEAFHCVDSALHGGMPRGDEAYWGEYWRTRNEMAADAFAMAMHLQRAGAVDAFATNLARLRGLALYGGDPQHFTYDAIRQVTAIPPTRLAAMSPRELAELAHRIGAEQLPDYQAFLTFWDAAHRAMAALGMEPATTGNEPSDTAGPAAAAPLVERMTTLSRRLHGELAGR